MAGLRVLGRAVSVGSALCLVVGCLVLLGATGSRAASTTFYVDSTAPCPGSGTQASPWCDFSVVDSTIYQPGDQILLKRGDTFTTEMLLQGSGTSTSYLTVSAYGSGAMPIINGSSSLSFTGLDMINTSYVQVENLSFENSGIGAFDQLRSKYDGLPILGSVLLRRWHWNPIHWVRHREQHTCTRCGRPHQIL